MKKKLLVDAFRFGYALGIKPLRKATKAERQPG